MEGLLLLISVYYPDIRLVMLRKRTIKFLAKDRGAEVLIKFISIWVSMGDLCQFLRNTFLVLSVIHFFSSSFLTYNLLIPLA